MKNGVQYTKTFNAYLIVDAPPPTTRERPPGCRTIFVGGLPENIAEDILREMFENCGAICSIRISKKNFAHIRFEQEESVEKSLYLSGKNCLGFILGCAEIKEMCAVRRVITKSRNSLEMSAYVLLWLELS